VTAAHPVLALYVKDLKARGFTPRTCENARQRLRFFFEYLEATGVSRVGDLTAEDILGYQTHLQERRGPQGQRLGRATQLHDLVVVRSFCRFLLRRRLVLADPSQDLVLPRVPRRLPAIPTTREVLQFLRAIDTRTPRGVRDRAIFETLYSTGLRASELAALTPADVDLAEGLVRVRSGKGGKSRIVPLGKIAARWIGRYLAVRRASASHEDALFLSTRGQPLRRDTLSDLVRHWAARSGLKKRITCHTFRHACATHMLRGRANLRHVQELLGHARLTSTQIYTHLDIQDLKRVHTRCHPRSR